MSRAARPNAPIPRLSLRPTEAAAALGVSEDHFRDEIAPALRWVRQGRVKLVAISEIERWIDENAQRWDEAA